MEKLTHVISKHNTFFVGWICGFIDGEGCFCVSFNYRSSMPQGIEVRPSFSVSQKAHSLESLQFMHKFFNCGGIRYSNKDGTYKYEVRSIDDLNKIILPFFRKYHLLTKKNADLVLFDEICSLVAKGQHLNKLGLKEILLKAYKMNVSGKRKHSLEDLLKFIGELKV